jgi:hypothetical protein
MPVHSGRNFLTSSNAAAAKVAAVLFKALANTSMSSTIEVVEMLLLSTEFIPVFIDETLEEVKYELDGGGETKKPLVLLKSKKQWSDQWHELAKRMRRRNEQ